jgi:hypothetical protein
LFFVFTKDSKQPKTMKQVAVFFTILLTFSACSKDESEKKEFEPTVFTGKVTEDGTNKCLYIPVILNSSKQGGPEGSQIKVIGNIRPVEDGSVRFDFLSSPGYSYFISTTDNRYYPYPDDYSLIAGTQNLHQNIRFYLKGYVKINLEYQSGKATEYVKVQEIKKVGTDNSSWVEPLPGGKEFDISYEIKYSNEPLARINNATVIATPGDTTLLNISY